MNLQVKKMRFYLLTSTLLRTKKVLRAVDMRIDKSSLPVPFHKINVRAFEKFGQAAGTPPCLNYPFSTVI